MAARRRLRGRRVERPARPARPRLAHGQEPARGRQRHGAALLGHVARRAGAVRPRDAHHCRELLGWEAAGPCECHYRCGWVRDQGVRSALSVVYISM